MRGREFASLTFAWKTRNWLVPLVQDRDERDSFYDCVKLSAASTMNQPPSLLSSRSTTLPSLPFLQSLSLSLSSSSTPRNSFVALYSPPGHLPDSFSALVKPRCLILARSFRPINQLPRSNKGSGNSILSVYSINFSN